MTLFKSDCITDEKHVAYLDFEINKRVYYTNYGFKIRDCSLKSYNQDMVTAHKLYRVIL